MPRTLGLLAVLGVFTAVSLVGMACGGSDDGSGPPPLSTGRPPSRDAGGSLEAGAGPIADAMPELEAGPGATTYKGTLDATEPVTFGGEPYCEYTMTLKDIEIEIASLESGDVIGAIVKDLAVEAVVPPCQYLPMDPSMQRFALTTVTKTASGATLAFEGASTNQPQTSLVIDLARVGVTYEASVGWKRIDLPPPLAWEVRAKLTLTAQ